MYRYEWENDFVEDGKLHKSFIKSVFNALNKGTVYTDSDGKFVGRINALKGPLGIIHFISDHSLDSDNHRFIIIKVIYLDENVLYFRIDGDSLMVFEFSNGRWANSVQRRFGGKNENTRN